MKSKANKIINIIILVISILQFVGCLISQVAPLIGFHDSLFAFGVLIEIFLLPIIFFVPLLNVIISIINLRFNLVPLYLAHIFVEFVGIFLLYRFFGTLFMIIFAFLIVHIIESIFDIAGIIVLSINKKRVINNLS